MMTDVSRTQDEKLCIVYSSPVFLENRVDILLCLWFSKILYKLGKCFPDYNFNPCMFREIQRIFQYQYTIFIDRIRFDRCHEITTD